MSQTCNSEDDAIEVDKEVKFPAALNHYEVCSQITIPEPGFAGKETGKNVNLMAYMIFRLSIVVVIKDPDHFPMLN